MRIEDNNQGAAVKLREHIGLLFIKFQRVILYFLASHHCKITLN